MLEDFHKFEMGYVFQTKCEILLRQVDLLRQFRPVSPSIISDIRSFRDTGRSKDLDYVDGYIWVRNSGTYSEFYSWYCTCIQEHIDTARLDELLLGNFSIEEFVKYNIIRG